MTDTNTTPEQGTLPLIDENPPMPMEPVIDGIPLSAWFPPDIQPAHVGVYKTQLRTPVGHGDDDIQNGFSYWDGKNWGPQFDTAKEAEAAGAVATFPPSTYYWRGLTAEHEEHQL